jgi:hypothetical protein
MAVALLLWVLAVWLLTLGWVTPNVSGFMAVFM